MLRKKLLLLAITLTIALAAGWVWHREFFYPYLALVLPLDQSPATAISELALEKTIPLGEAKGRIDHMAIDLGRKRLFIAELGNNSVGVVDLQHGRLETRLTGFDEPQGIAYVPRADTIFIANGGSGVVEMRRGGDLSLVTTIRLGDDADNVRAEGEKQVIVGYAKGGLAVLDANTGEKREDIPLAAHPESFQLDPEGGRVFVNEPGALAIAVIDRKSGKELARWEATRRTFTLDFFFPGIRASVSSTLTLIKSRVISLKILIFMPILWLAPARKEGLFCVAEDEQHNSSEEAGGHFPFLHFQAALDSASEIQARLNTQGIH